MEFDMRKRQGFTLMELLVVIAIIALLMGILAPALSKVKEMGRKIVCLSNIRSFGTANMTYSAGNNGYYVPFSKKANDIAAHTGPYGYWDERWPENEEYRRALTLSERVKVESAWDDPYIFPDELMCPSHKRAFQSGYIDQVEAALGWPLKMSYAMNCEKWVGSGDVMNPAIWMPSDMKLRAYKMERVKRPQDSMMFVDSNYYQTRRYCADYRQFWDVIGDQIISQQQYAQTCYRHSERTTLVYFDGHAGDLKKEEVYDIDNPTPRYNPKNRRPDPLWDAETFAATY